MSPLPQGLPTAHRCPVCGLELPVHVPAELCPKCLLKTGLVDGEAATVAATPATGRPAVGAEFGHYRLVRLLGAGGMGAVYEAVDLDTDRCVALKVLSHRFDAPEARKRFLREGRLAASINHPNSVYVFGTEEIGGVPVIAMELMPGGTLEQRVRAQGPFDIREAADAALHIIDGLEAAYAVGILHRDIKPSNCFLDADGTVKIGDFGLSISTETRGEPPVTIHESFMGTPAFAAPEQLRGDDLTVGSDIYSIGVTLFYLLTARLPYESQDMVRLLAKVLENPAPSPAQFRPDMPVRLGQVVRRCLEKCPSDRFKNYDELRRALAPFSSLGTKPAELAVRCLAGALDVAIVGLPLLLVFRTITVMRPAWGLDVAVGLCELLFTVVISVAYFALLEWRYGWTLGKALLRLRVVDQAGRRPGFLKTWLRAAVFVILPVMVAMIEHPPVRVAEVKEMQTTVTVFGRTVPATVQQSTYRFEWSLWQLAFCGGAMLLLFCAARRRNGYAAGHDGLTETRVVMTMIPVVRPALTPVDVPADAAGKPSIGPFHVLGNIAGAVDWFEGYDSRLFRRVWIHKVMTGTPPVPRALRNLGRVGRLRWITGKRSTAENWDAYEGLTGQPLLKLIETPPAWSAVRFWLLDLANELQEAQQDGTWPAALGVDKVWVTGDGRVKLLDFPAPGLAAGTATGHNLLKEIATRCLGNRPVPVPVREFLNTAGDGDAVHELQRLMKVPVAVSRMQRLGIIAAGVVGPALSGLSVKMFTPASPVTALVVADAALILLGALPALLMAAVAREGLLLRLFGVAIVGHDGMPATRTQTTRRSLLAWLPCLLSPLLGAWLAVWMDVGTAGMAVFVLLAGLAVMSAALPDRSLQDRLTGTWLVPR